ncbi:hypothetical protein O9K51_01901 [Purpureocillium lavendulum]|uniref:Methyltransferase domain-containing protein n=1 Tax=Purpureocillium lavendulum TaxID=1247861 RepID=A0AB34G8S8_9HYPO|nr:hypothetical protein O9K51_01901 [Purpureocillium lavendulum]
MFAAWTSHGKGKKAAEIARSELMHSVLSRVFDDRLIFPPVPTPERILDCGCGACDWAVDVAERFPESEVLGIDISPHMIPEELPENLEIQIDDLNGRFTFPTDHFDVVHSRLMAGGIHANRWRSYVQDMFRVLKPGGWCQMVEIYFNAQSDNGTLERGEYMFRSAQGCTADSRLAQSTPFPAGQACFTEVESRLLTLPMCGWSNVPRDGAIGRANTDNIAKLLYSMALYPVTKLKGVSAEDFTALVDQASAEANNPSFKSPDAEAALINPAQNDARRAANPSAVTTLYQLALAFRLLSWMFSCIVLGFAANTVAHAVTAEIKRLAGLLIALSSIHVLILWYPTPRPASPTDPRAPRLYVISVAVSSIMWTAAVGVGCAMLALTSSHADDPDRISHDCKNRKHRCFRPTPGKADFISSCFCTAFAGGILLFCSSQLGITLAMKFKKFKPEGVEEVFRLSRWW